jgi:hypothetical protein
MEILSLLVIRPALLVGFVTLLVGIGQVLAPEQMTRLGRAAQRPQFNLWQVLAAATAVVLLLFFFQGGFYGFDTSYRRYQVMWMLFSLVVGLAMVVFVLAVLFHLSHVGSPEWARRVGSGFRTWKFNLWQMMAVVVVAVVLLHAFSGPPTEERVLSAVLLSVGILAWFMRTWCNEFVFLMGLKDEEFPGRNDKLIWSVVLLLFAPIGVWLFRSYRLAHWPAPKSVIETEFDPEPARGGAAQPARA